MKYTAILLTVAATIILAGCSSMKVTSEQTGEFDFSQVKTYEWVKAPAKILDEEDTYLNKNMHKALNAELLSRNWKETADKADIQIVYYIKLAEYQEYSDIPDTGEPRLTGGFTYNTQSGSWNYNDQQPDLNVYTVEVGTLSLLIYDTKTNNCIWQGTLRTRLDRSTPSKKQWQKFQKVAEKIVRKIP